MQSITRALIMVPILVDKSDPAAWESSKKETVRHCSSVRPHGQVSHAACWYVMQQQQQQRLKEEKSTVEDGHAQCTAHATCVSGACTDGKLWNEKAKKSSADAGEWRRLHYPGK